MKSSKWRSPFILASLMLGSVFVPIHASAFDMTHSLWDKVLQEHVHNRRVDYKKLKANDALLSQYLDSLAGLRASEYEAWGRENKIALWINAYNALTLKAIIDHYPIQPSWSQALRYPKNSIRQIPGVWDKLHFGVMGQGRTLDEIEHDILRRQFADGRVHMALVCASLGCPPLRGEAFTGLKLNSQLDDQARVFLRTPSKFRIDRGASVVYLSPIFKWFSSDFAPKDRGGNSALPFIAGYLEEPDRRYLEAGHFRIQYLDYDWSLNE